MRLIRLWFTDVLGQLKSVAISPAELENAFEEGMQFDGSAIDGFSRVQESDVLARPDPNTFELLPWSRQGRRRRPGCSATSPTSTARRSRATRARCSGATSTRPANRASRSSSRRRWSSSTSNRGDPSGRPSRSTPARTSISRPPTWPATSASERSTRSRPWASPWSTRSTRTARASTRSTCATPTRSSMADNVMTFRLVVREIAHGAGRVRHVHAQADRRACRARACTPTCRCSRARRTRSTSRRDPYLLSKTGPGVHRRAACTTPGSSPR